MLSRENLHPYQEKFVKFIRDNKRVFGLLDLGLGKSVSTLTAITDLIDGFAVNRVLVVAPLRVANSVWKQEVQKWQHLSHLRVNVATGSEKARISALSSTADVYVINRENVKWLVDFYGKNWPFDCLVIDESSSFKSNSSQRFKALKKILPFTEYAVLLTGTPSPNGLLDLWAQVYLIDQGLTLGRTMTAYKQRFFEADYMGYKFTPREGAKDKIHKLIEPFSLSMSAEDYLQMPDRFDLVEPVQLPPAALKQYQDFEADLVAEIDGHELDAQSAAVLANKLLQFCISENTLVVTSIGFVPIQLITPEHEIWDGENWVNCYGSICNGYKEVVNCYGIYMTPEHKVLTKNGWFTAKEVLNGEPCERFEREYLRNPHRITSSWIKKRKGNLALSMRVRERSRKTKPKFEGYPQEKIREVLWLFARFLGKDSRYEQHAPNDYLAKHDQPLLQSERQGFQKLRGSRHNGLRRVEKFFRKVLGRFTRRLFGTIDIRSDRQFSNVLQTELSMGYAKRARQEHAEIDRYLDANGLYESDRSGGILRNKNSNTSCQNISVQNAKREMVYKTKVYDLINCGTNNRFTVVDDKGHPLIVHNCNGAIYTDDKQNYVETHSAKLDALAEIVEDNPNENLLVAYNYKSDLERLAKRFPDAVLLDKNPDTITRWNNGEIKMLLAHPASASMGLNLQRGGSVIIWFGLNWSLEYYQQFNGRLHRQGQEKPVRIIHLVAKDCIDEKVMRVISDKAATQSDLLNAVKELNR